MIKRFVTFIICIVVGITVVPIAKVFVDSLNETSQPASSLMLAIPIALLLFVFAYAIKSIVDRR